MQKMNEFFCRLEERWRGLSPRRRMWTAAALLTAAILAGFGVLLAGVTLLGSGLIFKNDDFHQHYPFLQAIGRWVRAFFADPASAPLFDFSLGFGADWIASLSYYGVGDPLTLLMGLFPESATYAGYVTLVALRLVLAGLAFLVPARLFGFRWRYSLTAAAAYAFTNYMVACCVFRHPFFANPLIHLPLMIAGAEKRLRGEGPAMLILSTAWSAVCGFYFLYMNSAMLFVYALARHFVMCAGDRPWRRLPAAFLRAAGPYLLGLCVAAAFLIPAVLGYLACGRGELAGRGSLLWFEPSVYWSWPTSFVASNGWYQSATVPVAALFAIAAVFRSPAKNRALALSVAAAAVALLIPVLGWALNGFSYVSDRWKYGALLLFCMVFARYGGESESGEYGRGLCVVLLGWCAVLLARRQLTGAAIPHGMLILLAAALLAGSLAESLIARAVNRRLTALPALRRAASGALLCAFVAVNLLANSAVIAADLLLNENPGASAQERHEQSSLTALERTEAPAEFGRTDLTYQEYYHYNASVWAGAASTSVYTSIRPQQTAEFMQELMLNTEVTANRTHGLDGRAALEAVWAVNRLTAPSGTDAAIPYGFAPVYDDGVHAVWENTLSPGMAYPMDEYITRAEYDAMSPVEKQMALISCAVTEEADDRFVHREWTPLSTAVEWTVTAADNAVLADGGLSFGPGGGSVTISFDGLPDCETYVFFRGLHAVDTVSDGRRTILMESHGTVTLMEYPLDGYAYSLRRRDFLNHLGYSEGPRSSVTLRCQGEFALTFGALEIVCLPMAGFEETIAQRRDGTVTLTEAGANAFTAETDFGTDRMLVFAVPALDGWSATIDGERAELQTQAGALCMVKVPAGAHTVRLSYFTPGLRAGLTLSAAGVAVTIGWLLLRRARKRRWKSVHSLHETEKTS